MATSRHGTMSFTLYNAEYAPRGKLGFSWEHEFVSNKKINSVPHYVQFHSPGVVGLAELLPMGSYKIWLPHWSLIILAGAMAIVLKPRPRFKFSLRALMLFTTIVAVVFGLVAALEPVRD